MLSFNVGNNRFDLRAVAVILSGNFILLHKLETDDYWSLPGGRVEMGEDAASAVAREVREELAIDVSVGPLLWVVENFFPMGDRSHHEVGLYFATQLPEDAHILDPTMTYEGRERDQKLIFAWFPRHELAGLDLRPAFVRDALAQVPLEFAHVVNRDPPQAPA
jgi:ADP-ribose pyrophosphatase YjhB (NUDIX family)